MNFAAFVPTIAVLAFSIPAVAAETHGSMLIELVYARLYRLADATNVQTQTNRISVVLERGDGYMLEEADVNAPTNRALDYRVFGRLGDRVAIGGNLSVSLLMNEASLVATYQNSTYFRKVRIDLFDGKCRGNVQYILRDGVPYFLFQRNGAPLKIATVTTEIISCSLIFPGVS